MLAKVNSCAVVGMEGYMVQVEVDISPGLPAFFLVGLPDEAIQESKERVRGAIRNSGFTFPMKRISVNLAPADLKKEGPAYDLPIAVAVLLSSDQLAADVSKVVFLGELSLDGALRHTSGILPMVGLARQEGFTDIVVPAADACEAALVEGTRIMPFASLAELAGYLRGETPAPEFKSEGIDLAGPVIAPGTDLEEVKGQEHVKRALEVAASGGHKVLHVVYDKPGASRSLLPCQIKSI
jgi:magnesium chelatase family protein